MRSSNFSSSPVTVVALTLIGVILLSACRKDDKPPVNLLESQHKQLEKARQVEGTLQKAADAQSKAIDAESGVAASKEAATQ